MDLLNFTYCLGDGGFLNTTKRNPKILYKTELIGIPETEILTRDEVRSFLLRYYTHNNVDAVIDYLDSGGIVMTRWRVYQRLNHENV